MCISGVGTYKPMFSCKNISVLCEVFVGTCVSLFGWNICVYVLCYEEVSVLIGMCIYLFGWYM